MSKPFPHRTPDIKRFSSRAFDPCGLTRQRLETEKLLPWMQEVVNYIGQNQSVQGIRPASYLVATASGIDMLMYGSANSMRLGTKIVYASFLWGRRTSGAWYIRHVKFSLNLSESEISNSEKQILKDRLLDKAETAHALHFPLRERAFPAENYVKTFPDDVEAGHRFLEHLLEDFYESAKEAASMPQNPFSATNIGLSAVAAVGGRGMKSIEEEVTATKTLGEGLQRNALEVEEATKVSQMGTYYKGQELVESAEHTEKFLNVHGVMEKVAKSHEILEHLKEDDEEEWTVLKTTKWDKMAVKGINVGGDIADIFIPGASLGMKLVATMFFQIAISNYSGKIRRIRIRVYTDLIGGFINYLTLSPNDPPLKNKRDQAYYDEGARKVQRMSDRVKFQYQIALLDYARTHLTSGPWGGTTYALHRLSTPNWHYPDDWEAKWSPAALTASLVTMLSFPRFLYE